MKTLLRIFVFLMCVPLMAQMNVISIDAYVLDGATQRPIEFVNLNVVNRDLGTVTKTDGTFHLEFIEDQIGTQDVIKISALGYATKELTMETFYSLMERNNILYLNPYNEAISNETVESVSKNSSLRRGVSGTVSTPSGPVQGAIVGVKGSYKRAVTNVNGDFALDAMPGDVLQIESLITFPKEVTAQKNMKVTLDIDGELLEQVEVTSEKKTFLSERKFETAYGKKEFNRIGYRLDQLDEEDLNTGYQNLEQLFFQLPTSNFNLGSSITLNNGRATVVDDILYAPGDLIPLIDVQNVQSVTVIPGISGAVKYGTLGRNGVIIIRTKTYATAKGDYKPEAKKQGPLVQGNNFNEALPVLSAQSAVPIKNAIVNAPNFESAKQIYTQQMASQTNTGISYYVDAALAFAKWDKAYASQVALNILDQAAKNTKALKTLAYTLESLGDLEGAKSVYQRLAILAPSAAQSYRDLAHIYKETGEYTKSFALYKRILANKTEGVDFSGIQALAESELRHLIANHKDKVYYKDLPNSLLQTNFKKDVRIVFEWNDPLAEFDLQFVNPNRKYFTLKNTKFDNYQTMKDQLEQGFTVQEFEIDDSVRGSWQVNLEAVNATASANPVYLKYTIYNDYGKKSETVKTGLVNLSSLDKKVNLEQVNY